MNLFLEIFENIFKDNNLLWFFPPTNTHHKKVDLMVTMHFLGHSVLILYIFKSNRRMLNTGCPREFLKKCITAITTIYQRVHTIKIKSIFASVCYMPTWVTCRCWHLMSLFWERAWDHPDTNYPCNKWQLLGILEQSQLSFRPPGSDYKY